MDFQKISMVRLLMVKIVVVFGVFVYSCQSIAGPKGPVYLNGVREMDTTEIQKYHDALAWFFDSLLNTKGFSGGILVAKNGKILYEHYQGDVYGSGATPIDSRTPFHVASTSKTFTSTAILQLEAKGMLKLDDSLTKYWPSFPYPSVTIQNLLNHSSGIPDYAYFLTKYGWNKKETATNDDVLNYILQFKPRPDFNTGARFKYCNTNFVLLALLVEKVSGLTFPFYVKENIFQVAGMEDSYILTAYNKGDYMPSWTESGRVYNYEYLDGLYGDKNVFTTCRDLMKYDSAIRTGLLLDPVLYYKAWQPYFKDTKYDEPWEYYGLGWRLKLFDNNLMIPYHNGWWHGNNAVFQRLVADTAVIIVTGNRMNRKIYASAKVANLFRTYYPDSILAEMDSTNATTMEEGQGDKHADGQAETVSTGENGKVEQKDGPMQISNKSKPPNR
ncbi:MAG: beta-lactamase family protein [Chitinophagaceae bacterium]|nr:beta-lactamase family protein [Chitinophagaceae bacterium]